MRLTFAHPYNSIESAVSDDEIPDFIVLSGPNGSVKTNLLEAIQAGASAIEGVPIGRVRLFTLAQLVLTAEGPQSASTYRNRWLPLQQVVQDYVTQMTTQPNSMVLGSDELEEEVRARVKQSRLLTPEAFQRMFDDSSKRLIDFTGDDFRRYAPLIVGIRDPFSLTVNELFLTYHQRRERNEIDQWREETKRTKEQVALTDGDFIARFGPAPWDLLNETLSVVGLDYY